MKTTCIALLALLLPLWAHAQVTGSDADEKLEQKSAPASAPAAGTSAKKDAAGYVLPTELYGNNVVSQQAWVRYYRGEGKDNPRVVQMVKDYVPGTYAAKYIEGMEQPTAAAAIPLLEEALRLNPAGREAYQGLALQYERTGNGQALSRLYTRWSSSGAAYTAAQNTLAYNQLASVQGPGILVACSDDAAWALSLALGKQQGLQLAILTESDITGNTELGRARLQQLGIGTTLGTSVPAFLQQVQRSHPTQNLYLAIDCSPTRYPQLSSSLYLVGMVYQYSSTALNNMEMLANAWEHRMRLPALGKGRPAAEELLYFYPMAMLARYYQQKGQDTQYKQLRTQAEYLARQLNRTDLIAYLP